MDLVVSVTPNPNHCFWEEIKNKEQLKQYLEKKLKNPDCYFWIEDRSWIDGHLEILLLALVEVKMSTCRLEVYPHKNEISIRIKALDDFVERRTKIIIYYDTGEPPKEIIKTIAQFAYYYWENRTREPAKKNQKIFKECEVYLK
jgi:hypothetical protein